MTDTSNFLRRISNKIAIGTLVSLFFLLFRVILQPVITVNNGQGWDGSLYYRMAINAHALVQLPFRLRIGLPLLVHVIPGTDVLSKFQALNLVFGFLFGVICYVGISRFSTSLLTSVTAWLLICATGVSPIPFSAWYPTNADTIPNLLFLLLLIPILSKQRTNFLLILLLFALGTVFRENFPIFL